MDPADAVDREPGHLERVRRDRPALYASRHVLKAALRMGLALLGIGALVRRALPWLDQAAQRLHALRPTWLPDPLGWLVSRLPDGFAGVLGSLRWWLPPLIAIMVAVAEVGRRRGASQDVESSSEDP